MDGTDNPLVESSAAGNLPDGLPAADTGFTASSLHLAESRLRAAREHASALARQLERSDLVAARALDLELANAQLNDQLAAADVKLADVMQHAAEASSAHLAAQSLLAESRSDRAMLEVELQHCRDAFAAVTADRDALLRSRSWRVTRIGRRAASALRRLAGRPTRSAIR